MFSCVCDMCTVNIWYASEFAHLELAINGPSVPKREDS